MANARLLSKAVAASGAQGVILDTEIYSATHPWAYNADRYVGQTFEEVEAIVRARGAGFMAELTSEVPDAEIMLLHSIGYLASVTRMNRALLPGTEYALLPAFVEGMLTLGQGTVIDGDEYGYYVDETTEFPQRRLGFDRSKEFSAPFMPADADYQLAAPVFMDLTLGLGPYDRGYPAAYERSWFEHNVYHALLATDEYAWVYGQRVDWWRNWIPEGALESLTAAATRFRAQEPLGYDMVAQSGTSGPPSRLVSDPTVAVGWEELTPGQASLAASASGATRMEFYDGSRLLGVDGSAPFSLEIAASCHSIELNARAFGADRSHTTSNIVAIPPLAGELAC